MRAFGGFCASFADNERYHGGDGRERRRNGRPELPRGMHGGNDGKLRGVRWQGEAEVTADGGGLRLLPAAVRRNVPADGVALLSVRRERERPHPGGAGDAVGGRLCLVERAVYETLQRVQLSLQLVESAGGKAQRDVGHHLADNAADVRLRPGGDGLALDGEVPDGRTALHAAEKAVLRAALRQAQAGDLVSLSVEVSEEDRDRDGGAVRDASGDDAQVDVAVDAGADKATDRAADLTGHKADDKHTLARLVRPRGGGHGDAGLIRQSAAEQQNLRQNEQHEQH